MLNSNSKPIIFIILFFSNIFLPNTVYSYRKYDKDDLEKLREEVRQMFQHAYNSYLTYAYPYDELRPLSCDGIDTWGSYSLTLIDALDTLAVMGNYSEFKRVAELVANKVSFDSNINVSVFETNIRIVGGLLSAHLLSHKAGVELEPGWPCNGPLLRLAEDVARRLITAFDTPTGMPYGTINLRNGVPEGETPVTCTAGVGTFIVEFGTLSRLTGDPLYEEVAIKALNALYHHRSSLGLMGNHIDVISGRWTAQDAGIGAGVDSYYEYLVKGSALLQRPELLHTFHEGRAAIDKYLKRDDWHLWVSMHKGQVTLPVFQSLEAYWPGLLSIIGDVNIAMRSLHNYHQVWKQYGFTPEFYNIPQGEAGNNRESYPLRPELIESVMYLYRATKDPYLLEVGVDILRSIQHSAKTNCGYATIKDVRDHRKEDRMESFFLAETTKYLYLLFDTDNFLHNNGQRGTLINTPWGECIIESGNYIFNTEAHPIDPGALHCCTGPRNIEIQSHIQSQLLADLDPQTFSSLKGEKLRTRKRRPVTITSIPISVPNLETPNVAPTITTTQTPKAVIEEPNKEKFNSEEFSKQVGSAIDVIKLKSADNQSYSNNEEGIGSVESLGPKPTTDDSIIQPLTTSDTDTKPNFSGKITTRKSSSVFRADEEILDNMVNNHEPNKSNKIPVVLPSFVKQLLNTKQFDPQILLQRLRANTRYNLNSTWLDDFEILKCSSQPFIQRLSILGEFFET